VTVAVFSATPEDRRALTARLAPGGHDLRFFADVLDPATFADHHEAEAGEWDALCVFVHDHVSAEVIAAMPCLRLIATRSTGFDHIELGAARDAGVTVCNVPTYGENTVAEYAFALMLSLTRRLHTADARARSGSFDARDLFGWDLKGKTLGIIGAGHIGLHVARIARGFLMEVIATDPKPDRAGADLLGFAYTTPDDLLRRADIVSLHAPLTPETRHLMNAEVFAKMKPGAILINTARGGLVDTHALLEVLDSGHLRGAGLDVLEEEEQLSACGASLLEGRPNLIITPHMAYASHEAVGRIRDTTADNIEAFAAGRPENMVALQAQ
jgi:D-lactate dehydrogenase